MVKNLDLTILLETPVPFSAIGDARAATKYGAWKFVVDNGDGKCL